MSRAPLAILCFHRVLPAARRGGPDEPYFLRRTALDVDQFRALLDGLAQRYPILPPRALLSWAAGAEVATRPAVVLTFDDLYQDVLEHALPELAARGLSALACATTRVADRTQPGFAVDAWYAAVRGATVQTGLLDGFVGTAWSFDLRRDEDRARLIDGPEKRAFLHAAPAEQTRLVERLRRALGSPAAGTARDLPATLGVDDLRGLEQAGWMLGSHGVRHRLLPSLTEEQAREELAGSHAWFPAHGLRAAEIIAYPDGAADARIEALAEAAGYRLGLGLGSRVATEKDPVMHLPRLIPTGDATWIEERLCPRLRAAGW